MTDLITIGLPSKGRLKDKAIAEDLRFYKVKKKEIILGQLKIKITSRLFFSTLKKLFKD